jgi:hypothetical protein
MLGWSATAAALAHQSAGAPLSRPSAFRRNRTDPSPKSWKLSKFLSDEPEMKQLDPDDETERLALIAD